MTIERKRLGACIAVAGGLAIATAAIAGPSMSSAWKEIDLDADACSTKAQSVVHDNGFNTRFEVVSNTSIYGERGDYTALVRCATAHTIVYFVVAGPSSKEASRFMNAMRDGF
jgi:hypothetical protein